MSIRHLLLNIPFELERFLCAEANVLLRRRPASFPFLSGDSFRHMANRIHDETMELRAADLREGDVVFIKTDRLHDFGRRLLPETNARLILVVHNSDYVVDDSYRYLLDDDKIIFCFAVNAVINHPKLESIPLGLENQCKHNAGNRRDYLHLQLSSANRRKRPRVMVAFTLGTNPHKRFDCFMGFYRHPLAVGTPPVCNNRIYRKLLADCMFVASPAGNGPDCYRTWEAIYLGVVPIVERTPMNEFYASLGLPILIVDSWAEAKAWDESFLEQNYQKIMANADTSAAYADYWRDRIAEKQALIKA